AGHLAKVEEKPEVRKAGGVYYTPTYIVDYIVKQTVGKLCEAKSPKEVSKLRILDPACGSGSFLLGAYQFLLDWHRDWYTQNEPEKLARGKNPPIAQTASNNWRLTTSERKRILLNNLFGVDIDSQAVETTKLSLLLKVLEGETAESIGQNLRLFRERALPDLANNIKCGNSLIGPDFYSQQKLDFFDKEERYRINAFDWAEEFPAIMKAGGFDAVIGNPPYGALITEAQAKYLSSLYTTAGKNLDSYSLFIEKAIWLCRPLGRISMIVPTGWYSGPKFSQLRRLVASLTDPHSFVNLPYDIFKAWVDTTIFVTSKREDVISWPRKGRHKVSIRTFPKRHRIESSEEFFEGVSVAEFASWFKDGEDEYLTYANLATTRLIKKIRAVGSPLEELADVQRGITPFHLTDSPTHKNSKIAFDGTVRRYKLDPGEKKFVRFDETLAEFKPERYFTGPRLLLRELISRQFRLQAVKANTDFVTNKSMQSI
ncbi:MAG: N-6 DNA methylase, partial [Acidobacteriota bacterium]